MNNDADNAQIESEDVAAVNVLKTGDNDNKAKNTKIEDLAVLAPRVVSVQVKRS